MHMPPVGPFGNRSRSDAFHASPCPMFWTSIAKLPHAPRFMVAGPDLRTTSAGSDAGWAHAGIAVRSDRKQLNIRNRAKRRIEYVVAGFSPRSGAPECDGSANSNAG